ncbi:MAG: branched-chain amino acid ABC transporter permease, partial [Spirochaetales bacterium]|nr:branched-chain amino acid ABC transporter permease [Spirochaetales bacterium]
MNHRVRLREFVARHKRSVTGLLIALVIALPFLLGNAYYVRVATIVGIYIILASSLNIIIGFTGMFSLGHAAFYGIGAYTSAILTTMAGWPFWAALPAAGLVA